MVDVCSRFLEPSRKAWDSQTPHSVEAGSLRVAPGIGVRVWESVKVSFTLDTENASFFFFKAMAKCPAFFVFIWKGACVGASATVPQVNVRSQRQKQTWSCSPLGSLSQGPGAAPGVPTNACWMERNTGLMLGCSLEQTKLNIHPRVASTSAPGLHRGFSPGKSTNLGVGAPRHPAVTPGNCTFPDSAVEPRSPAIVTPSRAGILSPPSSLYKVSDNAQALLHHGYLGPDILSPACQIMSGR